jgi:hypothetical protein
MKNRPLRIGLGRWYCGLYRFYGSAQSGIGGGSSQGRNRGKTLK